MSRTPKEFSLWSVAKYNKRDHLERAKVWSDASLDEDEEDVISRATRVRYIQLEPEYEIRAALTMRREHDKFDRFIRDALHYLLCTNNVLDKPLQKAWTSEESPFTEVIGAGLLVEQIISRLSLKAVFLSKKIRNIAEAYDAIKSVFLYRNEDLTDNHNLLMMELCVIAFEMYLFCLIHEMLILPMKMVVRVCTNIYTETLKPKFKKRHCWKLFEKYLKDSYSALFLYLKMIFKTLGHPYDVFPIPYNFNKLWEAKVESMTDTFYDSVPLWYFHSILKDYKEEVAKLDLTPDIQFERRVRMRKAVVRKKYRRRKLLEKLYGSDTDSDGDHAMSEDVDIAWWIDLVSVNRVEELGAVGGAEVGAVGGADYGAVGAVVGTRVSFSKHQEKSVPEKSKHSIQKSSKTRSSRRVCWNEEALPVFKPEGEKKKLKSKNKKAVPRYIPEEALSDSESPYKYLVRPRTLQPMVKQPHGSYLNPQKKESETPASTTDGNGKDGITNRPPQPMTLSPQSKDLVSEKGTTDSPALPVEVEDRDKKDSPSVTKSSQDSDLKLKKVEMDPSALPAEAKKDDKKDSDDNRSRVPQPTAQSSQGRDRKSQKDEVDPSALPVEAKSDDKKDSDDKRSQPTARSSKDKPDPRARKAKETKSPYLQILPYLPFHY